jgi:hypothetical protein
VRERERSGKTNEQSKILLLACDVFRYGKVIYLIKNISYFIFRSNGRVMDVQAPAFRPLLSGPL